MRITAPAVHVLFTSITGPLTLELDTRTVATAGVKVREMQEEEPGRAAFKSVRR
jgi:hypothetical protein